MEIDRERTATSKLHMEMEWLRANADQAAARHCIELLTVQEQLRNYRQRVGGLEGNLMAVTANRHLIAEDLRGTRILLGYQQTEKIRAENLVAGLRALIKEAQGQIEELPKSNKPSGKPRKPKAALH